MSENYVCPAEDPAPLGGLSVLFVKAGCDVILAGVATAVNLFIVCALLAAQVGRRRAGRAGRPSSLFVLNLAVSDMLGGLVLMHYHVTQNACALAHFVSRRRAYCVLKAVSVVLPGMLSINSLAAIGVDRYLCIVHSLRYPEIMTTRRALALITVVWALSLCAAGSLLVGNSWQPPETPCVERWLFPEGRLVAVGLPMNTADLAVIVATHLCIRREASRSAALHDSMAFGGVVGSAVQHTPRPTSTDDPGGAAAGADGALARRYSSSSSVKSARVLLLVVGCYMGAFTPVILVMVLRALGVGDERQMEMAFRVCYTLANCNYIVNPFTYAWKNAHLKADLVALWARLSRCGRQGCQQHDQAVEWYARNRHRRAS